MAGLSLSHNMLGIGIADRLMSRAGGAPNRAVTDATTHQVWVAGTEAFMHWRDGFVLVGGLTVAACGSGTSPTQPPVADVASMSVKS